MANETINTGSLPNDGTGEPLRDAFTAVNENFTEIYTAGPVGSNVVITGNTITVTGVNNNLVLRANGIGNVQADANRHAMDWLRRNPRHMQQGVEVVPEMT